MNCNEHVLVIPKICCSTEWHYRVFIPGQQIAPSDDEPVIYIVLHEKGDEVLDHTALELGHCIGKGSMSLLNKAW